ncbi:MAG: hemerythrin domain-containing protein [Myxococcota bacterium]
MTLVDANQRVHDELHEALLQTMELLTALDVPGARARWRAFTTALSRHMETEERDVLPPYASLPHHERGGAPEHLKGDHTVLLRNSAACEERLASLDPASPSLLRDVVLALDVFFRLLHVMDHHTERETLLMYPALERALLAADLQRIARALGEPVE